MTCNLYCGNYFICYCSRELQFCNFHCENYIIRYCNVALMYCILACTYFAKLYNNASLTTRNLHCIILYIIAVQNCWLAVCNVSYYRLLRYRTGDLQFALWKLYYAVLLCSTAKFFGKKNYYKFSFSFLQKNSVIPYISMVWRQNTSHTGRFATEKARF
jgi:hypothetical protein